MAKGKGKSKTAAGTRNSDRPNGKAWKARTAAALAAGREPGSNLR
jgi:hypothetical protein